MPEIVIKYKNRKTLQALMDLAKYFDFIISSSPKIEKDKTIINGVTIIPADNSVDVTSLSKVFSGKNIETKKLRDTWQRKK